MEIILSGLNLLSAAELVKVDKDAAAAHAQILHLEMEETTAGTWGEM